MLFAEDFDAPPVRIDPTPEPAPEPEIVEPVFSSADLEAAREEGHLAGAAQSERGLVASRVQMLGRIADGVDAARRDGALVAEEAAEAVARTMLSMLTACLPALCAQHGATEVRALMRAVLPALTDERRIAVRVNPLLIQAVTDELGLLDCEIADCVVLLPNEQIAPGDARLSWQDGSAVRDGARIRAAVEEALAALGLLEKEMTDA